ncbi:hypothetical protein NQK81_01230 [Amycolatopsis roodepoortensis]|uniref:hypothetical protein n=1 Tax=Amycolatopsis roodepoortensis TaxID=700274 RepID=UPI00214AF289|nr:hypothetical protein [Amycolatopsis roodepoortensis]UUV32097.1 hypothetical protein NQK81_01230 [Amycolatopsis roodepoortensis]
MVLHTKPVARNTLAIEISRKQLRLIESIQEKAWRAGSPKPDEESPVPAMMRAFHMRVGAEEAVAKIAGREMDGIPFFEHEIDSVASAIQTLNREDPFPVAVDLRNAFLADLHRRLGYARTVRFVGENLPVFDHERLPVVDNIVEIRDKDPEVEDTRAADGDAEDDEGEYDDEYEEDGHEACWGIHRRAHDGEHIDCLGKLI